MTPVYLDPNHGAAVLPCPSCGRPLLLAVERMGRLLVGYRGWFPIGPGKRALLVCPAFQCNHREPVTIVEDPADALVYSLQGAADFFHQASKVHERTLDEIRSERDRFEALYQQTKNPKLPSLIRYWQGLYDNSEWELQTTLEECFEDGSPVIMEGHGRREVGYVRCLMHDAILLERADAGETVFLRVADFADVFPHYVAETREANPARLDFGGRGITLGPGERTLVTPGKHVVVNGHELMVDRITQYGLFKVSTVDPNAAKDLGLVELNGKYLGEFPAGVVEHYYLKMRYCYVGGYRLHLLNLTSNPDIIRLGTHKVETARALRMSRSWVHILGRKRDLRWFAYFRRDEIEREEIVQAALRMPRWYRAKV